MVANLPKNLAEARKRAGLTQQELADQIGVARSSINMYELGNREPKDEVVEKLAEALDTTPAELAGWSTIPRGFLEAYNGDEDAARRAWDAAEWSALMDDRPQTPRELLKGLAKAVGASLKVRSGQIIIKVQDKTYAFSEDESEHYVRECAEYLLFMLSRRG